MSIFRISLLSLFVLIFSSCDDTLSFDEQLEIDKGIIADYVAANNLTGEYTSDGLFYSITKEGNGTFPTQSSRVEVVYTGKMLDGTVFDSSQGFPVTFGLNQVISGWRVGIPFFDVGSEGYLIIPSHMAYGRTGTGNIPENSVLYFDIELLGIQ